MMVLMGELLIISIHLHRFIAIYARKKIIIDVFADIADVQECCFIQTNIHEGGLHSR
ncbi:hypothetical protein D3C86_1975150 [compost metagenome]